jgi:hypothetical protein
MASAAERLSVLNLCTGNACRNQPRSARGAKTDDAMPHRRRVRDEIRRFVETLPRALTEGSAADDR